MTDAAPRERLRREGADAAEADDDDARSRQAVEARLAEEARGSIEATVRAERGLRLAFVGARLGRHDVGRSRVRREEGRGLTSEGKRPGALL